MEAEARHDAKRYALAYVALVVLAFVSFGASEVHLGAANVVVAYAIAVAKASLVVLVFMHFWSTGTAVKLAAFVAVLLFAVLVALVVGDVVTRGSPPLLPTGYRGAP